MNSPVRPPGGRPPKELKEVSVDYLTDPTAVGESVEVLDQDIVNLDSADFAVKRVTVPLVECCLIYQWTKARLRTRTRISEDFDACTLLGPEAHGSLDGTKLQPHSMIFAGPAASGEIIVDSGYESVTLLVPPEILDEQLARRRIRADFDFPKNIDVWHPTTEIARSNFELGARTSETAVNTPEVFNDNHWARYGAQVEFIDALAATIESCNSDEAADTDKKRKSYSQIVRACEDFTLDLHERRPYVSDLCAAANVSERTLQYAFRDIMGMSPLTYLHRLRLHRARDELRSSNSESTTVTNIALNWGFWHFGEFSRAYKNCFAETPSTTLRASSKD